MRCSEDYTAEVCLVYNLGALECLRAVTWLPKGGLPGRSVCLTALSVWLLQELSECNLKEGFV